MLVLSRKLDEVVVMQLPDGQQIFVQILQTGERIEMGFEAPKNVLILREELLTRSEFTSVKQAG